MVAVVLVVVVPFLVVVVVPAAVIWLTALLVSYGDEFVPTMERGLRKLWKL